MGKHRSKLEAVRKQRKLLEEEARIELVALQRRLDEEEHMLLRLKTDLHAEVRRFGEEQRTGIPPGPVDLHRRMIAFQQKKILSQQTVIKRTLEEIEATKVQLMLAMQDRKMVETLEAEQNKEARKILQLKDQRTMDDIAARQRGFDREN